MEIIKNYNYESVKKKFILLYVLNIVDIIFTILLLETGMFKEINSIMVNIVEKPILSLILKVVLVGVLIFVVCKRMINATENQLIIGNIIINLALFMYIIINAMHIFYCVLYVALKLIYRI